MFFLGDKPFFHHEVCRDSWGDINMGGGGILLYRPQAQ
jgi:hypothetical protein